MKLKVALLAGLVVVVSGCAAVSQTLERFGYLQGDRVPDTIRILPPAPATDSPRGVADREVFKATRATKDGPRWTLAQADVAQSVPALMKDFSCAVGAQLAPDTAPKLHALFSKVGLDVLVAVNRPKDHYRRPRPYLIDEGEICLPKTEALAASPDYPSGHATWGWTAGLILAELAPHRSTDILVRARAYGESRVYCGVHSASAVDAARTNASVLVAALHGSPAFRADLDGVRAEIETLQKAGGPPADQCQAEAALTAASPE